MNAAGWSFPGSDGKIEAAAAAAPEEVVLF